MREDRPLGGIIATAGRLSSAFNSDKEYTTNLAPVQSTVHSIMTPLSSKRGNTLARAFEACSRRYVQCERRGKGPVASTASLTVQHDTPSTRSAFNVDNLHAHLVAHLARLSFSLSIYHECDRVAGEDGRPCPQGQSRRNAARGRWGFRITSRLCRSISRGQLSQCCVCSLETRHRQPPAHVSLQEFLPFRCRSWRDEDVERSHQYFLDCIGFVFCLLILHSFLGKSKRLDFFETALRFLVDRKSVV